MSEVFRTIAVGNGGTSRFRRFLAFVGPGYLVAVGYMDPGNWATSLAGGAAFGYTLLFVALLSNIMAILLQSLCARLAVASGRDLAQACRDAFPKWMSIPLWIFAELAIIATDLAEVIGTAIGLNLLFGIPLEIGVFITAADVFLILWLQNKGFRWVEAVIIALMALITASFAVLMPPAGFIPTCRPVRSMKSRIAPSITSVTGMVAAGWIFPVEVLMKSAPAAIASSLAKRTLS